jgi:tRNA-Thr(GGU) m(6)t(6)A37 methyltransferase TsaA
MATSEYVVTPVGFVSSPLKNPAEAPCQGDEGAPDAQVLIDSAAAPALMGISVGQRVVLLTWLHLASRRVLTVHPRDDTSRPLAGVFATRSQDRPNPIGMHEVEVLEVGADFLRVGALEAVDGTPVLDIKPVLGPAPTR